MEHVVEIGIFGNVYGEFGDTFPTAMRPLCDRFATACGYHINTMAKSSSKKS
jgi:hypothetical protein